MAERTDSDDTPEFGADDIVEVLEYFSTVMEGEIVAARLRDSGVLAHAAEQRAEAARINPAVAIYVRRKDLDEARALLAAFAEADGVPPPEPREPGAVGRFLNRVLGGKSDDSEDGTSEATE